MKNVIFFDIDTQYDFMRMGGKLYVPGAEEIIPNLKMITEFADKNGISVIASIDSHKMLVHKKIPETDIDNAVFVPNKKLSKLQLKKILKRNNLCILKQEHDVFSNPNTKKILKNVKKAYVYGVATDYCVKAAVLGLIKMGVETYVIKDAIKPVSKKNEKKELELLRKKGVKFLTTRQLLKRK
ncbi:isochorismatase family protein [Candidatus Woesearchaeota archaeon]|nr:isochorismatase family protein [Candidatus Woesearchaeota archaeon]